MRHGIPRSTVSRSGTLSRSRTVSRSARYPARHGHLLGLGARALGERLGSERRLELRLHVLDLRRSPLADSACGRKPHPAGPVPHWAIRPAQCRTRPAQCRTRPAQCRTRPAQCNCYAAQSKEQRSAAQQSKERRGATGVLGVHVGLAKPTAAVGAHRRAHRARLAVKRVDLRHRRRHGGDFAVRRRRSHDATRRPSLPHSTFGGSLAVRRGPRRCAHQRIHECTHAGAFPRTHTQPRVQTCGEGRYAEWRRGAFASAAAHVELHGLCLCLCVCVCVCVCVCGCVCEFVHARARACVNAPRAAWPPSAPAE
jgi:hypothetical protein